MLRSPTHETSQLAKWGFCLFFRTRCSALENSIALGLYTELRPPDAPVRVPGLSSAVALRAHK